RRSRSVRLARQFGKSHRKQTCATTGDWVLSTKASSQTLPFRLLQSASVPTAKPWRCRACGDSTSARSMPASLLPQRTARAAQGAEGGGGGGGQGGGAAGGVLAALGQAQVPPPAQPGHLGQQLLLLVPAPDVAEGDAAVRDDLRQDGGEERCLQAGEGDGVG